MPIRMGVVELLRGGSQAKAVRLRKRPIELQANPAMRISQILGSAGMYHLTGFVMPTQGPG